VEAGLCFICFGASLDIFTLFCNDNDFFQWHALLFQTPSSSGFFPPHYFSEAG
jgi:hypothetical protein